jgi:D-alanyl-D-alanine carboxypeptidase
MRNQSDLLNSKVDKKGGRKMKPRTIYSLILPMIAAVAIIFTVRQLTRPKFSKAKQELENLVTDTVKSNKQIRNCVLFVKKGDGSFSWSGAAGIASRNGQVPMKKDTPIYLASVTKLYTAAAIMKLYEQGTIALDVPMAKYLPADLIHGIHVYHGHDYSNEITVKQLLEQTSGIADYYDEKAKDGKTVFELFVADPTRTWTVEETIARARDDMTPNFKPGTAASYSDTNYQLLGKIIEYVTGKSLEAVFEEFFFQPLELKHTWLVGRSKPQAEPSAAIADVFSNDRDITRIRSNGAYWADGGIVSTVADAVAFLQALKEGKIIRRDTFELMHSAWHQLPNMPFKYGYGTMKFEISAFIKGAAEAPLVWGHSGSTGVFLYYAENLDLYMAGTIDQTEDKIKPIMLMINAMQVIAHAKSS